MSYSTRIADFYEVVVRGGGKTLEHTNAQDYWNLKNSALFYECPKQPEDDQSSTLLYTWSIISSMNIYRALQIGKMLKISSKGIGAKNLANDKIKSTILLAHAIGFAFDHILSPEELLGKTIGKYVHYTPEFLVTPFAGAYRLATHPTKQIATDVILKELAVKALPIITFIFKDNAEERYHTTFEELCANTSQSIEAEKQEVTGEGARDEGDL